MAATQMEQLVSLCKRRGFIFQNSDIYGGLQGVYDYGPLGVELKNNIKAAWWRAMVYERDDVEGDNDTSGAALHGVSRLGTRMRREIFYVFTRHEYQNTKI